MAKRDNSKRANSVESIRHKDKRKNIPTEELRDFVAQDENAPKTMLYPRDPSLDPQLVWKGKAAKVATARTLWVPAVNNHGGFGRWAFVEIADPWDAQNAIQGESLSKRQRCE